MKKRTYKKKVSRMRKAVDKLQKVIYREAMRGRKIDFHKHPEIKRLAKRVTDVAIDDR
jgi:hypothetical protein